MDDWEQQEKKFKALRSQLEKMLDDINLPPEGLLELYELSISLIEEFTKFLVLQNVTAELSLQQDQKIEEFKALLLAAKNGEAVRANIIAVLEEIATMFFDLCRDKENQVIFRQ